MGSIRVISQLRKYPVNVPQVTLLARDVLTCVGWADCDLGLVFVAPFSMAAHNRNLLRKEGSTDVISLPVMEEWTVPEREPVDREHDLGDILICPETIEKRLGHEEPFDLRVKRLLVHSVLHLLGHEHESDADALAMEEREDYIMPRVRTRSVLLKKQ